MHGCGNDFILFNNFDRKIELNDPKVIKRMCQYHFGIGADGVLVLEPSNKTDFLLRYYNADGYPSEMCGNGARCAVALASKLNLGPDSCSFEIEKKFYQAKLLSHDKVQLFMLDPQILLDENHIQSVPSKEFIKPLLVNTGVPHLVLQVNQSLSNMDVENWGRRFRYHPEFEPSGTNVNFINVLEPQRLQARIYERGVERETLASGTGSVACGFYAYHIFGWQSPVKVQFPGGELIVDYIQDFKNVSQIGPCKLVFEGKMEFSDFF
jgi:diaminopimelate epimerase